jgi:hypothetical protein
MVKHVTAASLGGADQGSMLKNDANREARVAKFRDAFVSELKFDDATAQRTAEAAANVAERL